MKRELIGLGAGLSLTLAACGENKTAEQLFIPEIIDIVQTDDYYLELNAGGYYNGTMNVGGQITDLALLQNRDSGEFNVMAASKRWIDSPNFLSIDCPIEQLIEGEPTTDFIVGTHNSISEPGNVFDYEYPVSSPMTGEVHRSEAQADNPVIRAALSASVITSFRFEGTEINAMWDPGIDNGVSKEEVFDMLPQAQADIESVLLAADQFCAAQ